MILKDSSVHPLFILPVNIVSVHSQFNIFSIFFFFFFMNMHPIFSPASITIHLASEENIPIKKLVFSKLIASIFNCLNFNNVNGKMCQVAIFHTLQLIKIQNN